MTTDSYFVEADEEEERRREEPWADETWTFAARIECLAESEAEAARGKAWKKRKRTFEALLPVRATRKAGQPKSWSVAEDARVIELVLACRGARPRWTSIASELGTGRNGKQIRERWLNQLDPSISKRPWTMAEDHAVALGVVRAGYRWVDVANLLPGRTDNSVKNRWHSIKRKLARCHVDEYKDDDSRFQMHFEVVVPGLEARVLPREMLVEAVASMRHSEDNTRRPDESCNDLLNQSRDANAKAQNIVAGLQVEVLPFPVVCGDSKQEGGRSDEFLGGGGIVLAPPPPPPPPPAKTRVRPPSTTGDPARNTTPFDRRRRRLLPIKPRHPVECGPDDVLCYV